MNERTLLAEENHAPGPWRAFKSHVSNPWWTIVADRCCVAELEGAQITAYNNPGSPKTVEANARLIAAAPELLEALKAVVAISDRKHDAWDAAHAAIAKAQGRL